MGKVMWLTFSSSLTDLCEKNSSFDSAKLRICYTGENRNGSYISKKTIEKNVESIFNCPVVCHYDRETNSIGGHDIEFVKDDDGNMRIVNLTQPVGLIPESANVWFETITEEDGTEHEYLCADALIWKRQEAYSKIKEDGISAQSMEIEVLDGSTQDGLYHINNFEFTAFALLGDCEPCFESASLELFSKSDYENRYLEMMRDLKEELKLANSPEGDSNKFLQKYSTEGGEKVLEENVNLSEQSVDEVADTEVDVTAEPIESESETTIEEETVVDESVVEEFELNSNISEELRRVVESEKIIDTWGDEVKHYYMYDFDLDVNEVYAVDMCDWNIYGFSFTQNGDATVVDWESKKRMKITLVEFDGGETPEQPSPAAPAFELANQAKKNYSDIKSKFDDVTAQIAVMEAELGALRAFKKECDEETAKNEREEIFSRFEDLNGIEAFETLRGESMNYDLDTLEEKCFAIRGRNSSVQKFSVEKTTTKQKVDRTTDASNEPYGGLFLQYSKGETK